VGAARAVARRGARRAACCCQDSRALFSPRHALSLDAALPPPPPSLGNIGRAVDIARSFPGVTSDDRLDIHVTFEYLCCVTLGELLAKVYPALDAVRWAPVNVSFSRAICNVDGSIILAADDASQAALGALVARFEAAIEAAGVAVFPRARMQGFHMTIATTDAAYAMDAALAAINAAVPEGTWTAPFALKNFAFLLPFPHEVRANLP